MRVLNAALVVAFIVSAVAAMLSGLFHFGILPMDPTPAGKLIVPYFPHIFWTSTVVAVVTGIGLWNWRVAAVLPLVGLLAIFIESEVRKMGLELQVPLPKGTEFLVPYALPIILVYGVALVIAVAIINAKNRDSG